MSVPGAATDGDPGHRLPGFVANYLSPALDEFEASLNRRWRADVVEYLYRANEMGMLVPEGNTGAADPAPDGDRRWDDQLLTHVSGYGGVMGTSHTNPADYCTYVRWVKDGQDGDLSDVPDHEPPGMSWNDIASHHDPSDYEYSSCPVGNHVFREIEELAKRERDNVLRSLPLFDAHDLTAVEQAHNALVELCEILGLDIRNEVGLTGHSQLAALTDVELQKWLGSGTNVAWWAHWTDLVPDILSDGVDSDAFFQSVMPTRHYHGQIAASLANLINIRAATILSTRENVINAVKGAAARLDEHAFEDTAQATTTIYSVLAVGSMILALGPMAATAGALALVAYLGDSTTDKTSSKLVYDQTRQGVVNDLQHEIADIRDMLHNDELEYTRSVSGLAGDIGALKPSHRALYDFTQAPGGNTGVQGFEVDPDNTLLVARHCFEASQEYERTIDPLVRVDAADPHLRDSDGAPIWADTQVIEIRETLIDFCRTSIARYFEAGQQTRDGLARTHRVEQDSVDTWALYEAQLDAARARQEGGGENPYNPDAPDHNGSEQGRGGKPEDHTAQPSDDQLDSPPVDPVEPGTRMR